MLYCEWIIESVRYFINYSDPYTYLVNDVQIERRCIHIQKGKGNKDRYVVLAESVVPYLEKYLLEYKPKRWLFEGIHGGKYSQRSVHNIFDKEFGIFILENSFRLRQRAVLQFFKYKIDFLT